MTSSNGEHATATDVTFEELIELETAQDAVDTEILRQHWQLSQPIFQRRRDIIARIPHFWPLVFDEAPPEIENHFQPSDAQVFAAHLTRFDVERFEIETEPRSVLLSFEFAANEDENEDGNKNNPYFEDRVLQKRFWWRRSLDGWSGLVSEPTPIRWKSGKDLTKGLTKATLELWNEWKRAGGEEKRVGFSLVKDSEAYTTLKTKLEESDFSMHSFFTLFTFVSTTRWVSAQESAEAEEKERQKRANKTNGTTQSTEDHEHVQDEEDDLDVTACPQGDDLVTVLVEELYANAIKYFTSAHEHDSDAQSEDDFEEDEDMEDADDDSEVEERSAPPKKKQKKSKHNG